VSRGFTICGVEIVEGAQNVAEHPFRGPTAFMSGNEGHGLSEAELAICDQFVYIPQYGQGTASLNVAIATSIVLHHYSMWAGYNEQGREGFKYVVTESASAKAASAPSAEQAKKRRLDRQANADSQEKPTESQPCTAEGEEP